MTDGRERHMSGHQQLAGLGQLAQKTSPDARCLLGVMFKTVKPAGLIKPDREHGVARERQPIAARRHADYTVPRGMAAGAPYDYPWRHLVLIIEQAQLALVLF